MKETEKKNILKNKLSEMQKEEKEADEKHGKAWYRKNHTERKKLKLHHASPTCYHVGNLEGNPVRRMMKNGNDVFETQACTCTS